MTDTPNPDSPADQPRRRLFVIRHGAEDGKFSYTVAEEVAHVGPRGDHHDALEGALHDSLHSLFRHGLDGNVQVVAFPAERDPAGGYQIFELVKPKGPHL